MENLLHVHPSYLIFPLFIIFLCLIKNSKLRNTIIIVSFILLFVFAETGADYNGYGIIYKYCHKDWIHGEWLFISICKVFNFLGVSYNAFRVIFLTFFSLMFAFSLSKLSNNFAVSFLISFLCFTIYLVSAYRQFATMAMFLFSLYLFLKKDKKITALIINFIAIFLHKMAIVQFVILLIVYIYEQCTGRRKYVEKNILKRIFIPILACCLVIRILFYIVLTKTKIGMIFMSFLSYKHLTLIDFGLLVRIIECIILTILYEYSDSSKNTNLIFSLYFISTLIYILMPLELIMERLFSNFRLLIVVLIPNFLWKNRSLEMRDSGATVRLYQVTLILIYILVFGRQIFVQSGYDLVHMLWG